MTKTIKFNLIIDDQPIRTIEDLQENFSIEDVLDAFKEGLLLKWLEVRNFTKYIEKVKKLTDNRANYDNVELTKELIKIFDVEIDEEKVNEHIYILNYLKEREVQLEIYKKENFRLETIIDDYHSGYNALIFDIIDHPYNLARIKANVREIEKHYFSLFELNFYNLFNTLFNSAPLAVFAILMSEKLRNYFIPKNEKSVNEDTRLIFDEINELVKKPQQLTVALGAELKVFKGNTEAYWKDIEQKGKKYMVIRMVNGNYIRNAGVFGEELSFNDVQDKYLILDGIDYKSNNSLHELYYMEV